MKTYDKQQWLADKEVKEKELKGKVDGFIEALARATDEAAAGYAIQSYLTVMGRFHKYSWNNCMLIWFQNPKATVVAGYYDWMDKFGRHVKKGSKGKGITIWVPVFAKREANAEDGTEPPVAYFRTGTVFDVADTEGDPLPELPNWKSPEKSQALTDRLTAFAESVGVRVAVHELGEAQGMAIGGVLVALDPTAGTKTLAHEIAHVLLHQRGDDADTTLSHEAKEAEAEATAFAVCMHFGLQPEGSANYLALTQTNGATIRQSLRRIQKVAMRIIEYVESQEVA